MCVKALQTLTKLLEENSKVLLVSAEDSDMDIASKLSCAYKSLVEKNNVLILTDMQHLKEHSDRIYIISTQEAEIFRKLYETYEFSDRFAVLSPADTNYGTLLNYVKSGLLTEEEWFRTLLEVRMGVL